MFKQFSMRAVVALAMMATPASATIVQILGQNFNLGGTTTWMQDSDGAGAAPLTTVDNGYAGAYNIRINGGATVQAFCIDLFRGLAVPFTYNNQSIVMPTSNTLTDMTRVSRAAWIFSDVFPKISALATQYATTQQTIAVALQFALWEVMVDGNSPFSLAANSFRRAAAVGAGNSANVDYAKVVTITADFGAAYQGPVNAAIANRSFILVDVSANGGNTQRLISVVPEPGTMALFGSALLALGLVARRRKA